MATGCSRRSRTPSPVSVTSWRRSDSGKSEHSPRRIRPWERYAPGAVGRREGIAMKKWVWVAVIAASLVTGYAVAYALRPAVPNITGYLEGEEILFQHTEGYDPKGA